MPSSIERSALVSFSDQVMFDLVNDVEAYPEFMPGCVAATINQSGKGWVEATLKLQKSGISQTFTTRNTLLPPQEIAISLVKGPFKYFSGRWRFESLSETACKVVFTLSYEFSNPLLALSVGKILEAVAREQVRAVCVRAKQMNNLS